MKKLWFLLITVIVSISLVACGGSSGNNNNNNNGNNNGDKKEYAQGVTDDEVVIGSIGVQNGVLAFIGTPYYNGMEAYINKVNDEGGVNGRKVKLIKKDDEFNPEKSVQAMEELIYTDKVFAIVGQLGTPGVMATLNIVEDEGIPSVYFGSGVHELTEAGENFFPVQPSYIYEGKLMSQFAKTEFNADKIVVIYSNDDVGKDGLKGVKEGLAEQGISDALVEELAFNSGDTEFTVQVQKAKEANPDVVILFGLSGDVTGLLKTFENLNYDVPMITTYSNADASFLALAAQSAPEAVQNLHLMGWVDTTEEGLKPLVDAMQKYFPDGLINSYTIAGWVAAETFIAGLEAAGDNLSWDGFIDAMDNLTITGGLAPEIDYKDGKRMGVTKMSLSEVIKLEDGTFSFQTITDFVEFGE